MSKTELRLVDLDNCGPFTRVLFDITEYLIFHFDTYKIDDEGYSFVNNYLWFEFKIKLENKIRNVDVVLKSPSYMKNKQRLYLKITNIIGFDVSVDRPFLECEICKSSLDELPDFVTIIDANKIIKSKEKEMKNFKINSIKLNLNDVSKFNLNNIVFKIKNNKVKVIKGNIVKTLTLKEFTNYISKYFKDRKMCDLTKNELEFLDNSGIVERINLKQDVNLDDIFG